MGNQKKSGYLKGLFSASRSASSDSNLAKDPAGGPAGGPATGQSDADSPSGQSGQSSAALSPPTISHGRRLLNRLGRKSPSPSPLPPPLPEVETHNITTDHRIATSTSSSGNHGAPSTTVVQGSSYTPVSAPTSAPTSVPTIQVLSEPTTSESPAPPSPGTPHISPPKSDVHAAANPGPIEPPSQSSVVWSKAIEIAKKKLIENNLPPLDLTNLSTKSEEENIEVVIKSLNSLQEDEQKKRWSYTWRGKEIVIVKRLGEIVRSVEKYSPIVGTIVQSDPKIGSLVWASIQAIIRVTLNHVEGIEGFEVAIAALLEKMSICQFYSGIYRGVSMPSGSTENNLQLQEMQDSALPELYAAVIVFSVKAQSYFEVKGIKKVGNVLKSFDIEFQPFIDEIDAKEGVIRECADAATMERVKSIEGVLQHITSELQPLVKLHDISTKATKILEVTQDDRILGLLGVLSQLEPLKRHQDVKLHRSKDAGSWLLKLDSYIKWRNNNTMEEGGHVFCCYGIPGAGKTVMSSVVIDDLRSQCPGFGVACLYADYKDQVNQTLAHILGSVLRQLLTTAQEPIPDEVIQKLHDIQLQCGKVGADDNLALLKIRLRQLKRAFICLDAIDELEPKVRRQLLNTLKELSTSTNTTRFFLTGRSHVESEVQKCFQVTQGHSVVISANKQDIGTFVRQQMNDDPYPDAMDLDGVLEQEIVDAIIEKSQGMFLLPSMHIKSILEMPTNSQRREALGMLPTDLYDSFRDIVTRIQRRPSASAELGIRVLTFLHFAYRPLKLVELQHALAVKKSHIEFDAGNIPSPKVLLDSCLGLVLVDEETMTVRFVHFTLEEYFRDNGSTEFPNGCSSIAETCLTYLNFGELRQPCTSTDRLKQVRTKYSFLDYAALNWGKHVRQECNDGLTKLVRRLVEHESERPPCAIQALYYLLTKMDRNSNLLAMKFSGIHAIAYFGLSEHITYFCKVELKDDLGRTPLLWAAIYGHEAAVRLLIGRSDVDINAKDDEGKTALISASEREHETVVRLLVARDDTDINAQDHWENSPLICAAERGHEAVVRLLIERDDIDINAQDDSGRTALISASERGHETVVRLLVARDDTDINAKDNLENSPLICAAERGHEAVARLLIARNDIDINAKDVDENSPLILAAGNGYEAVVRLLVERDNIDINAKDHWGRTPLRLAAEYRDEAVVRLLIERDDIHINAKDNFGRTPFTLAVLHGYDAVVRLLIERDDVDINAYDHYGKTPLIWATENGHEAVVRLLTERHDIDINAGDWNQATSLISAARNGNEAVVRLLIERDDIDINAKDCDRKTPLIWATKNGNEAVVRLLIERGDIDINAKDCDGKTPLILAAWFGYEAVVWLLIERDDIDINDRDGEGRTALECAAERGRKGVVRLLIDRDDIDINAKGGEGRTALISAAWFGHERVVRLLIERDDIDINARDNNGRTALECAAKRKRKAIVQLLGTCNVPVRGPDIVAAGSLAGDTTEDVSGATAT